MIFTAKELSDGIQNNDISSLSKAITYLESTKSDQNQIAYQILSENKSSKSSIRIGISGIPGAGKSTFIEALGKEILKENKKIAILAIDPSSQNTKGSILGDKTRMSELSAHPNVFIRPSPTSNTLGGVNRTTRETIQLCELAGFDIIIVETVGVGQSEVAVHSMVDIFLLLVIGGAGDELQGIKRGIMEIADIIAINKAESNNAIIASQTETQIKSALHYFGARDNGWIPQVLRCSSLYHQGISEIWALIHQFIQHQKIKNIFDEKRNQQAIYWFEETLRNKILGDFYAQHKTQIEQIKTQILNGNITPYQGVDELRM